MLCNKENSKLTSVIEKSESHNSDLVKEIEQEDKERI